MANLVGQGGVAQAGPTSNTWTTPWPHRPGERARDNRGNEYIFCNYITTNVGNGTLVSIDPIFQAAPLLATSLLGTAVGIAQGPVSGVNSVQTAGANAGWVQIYGTAFVWAKGSTASTDVTSLYTNGVSVSEGDANGLLPAPQLVVTSPSGSLGWVAEGQLTSQTTLLVSDFPYNKVLIIRGMYILSQAQVSDLPSSLITERYPNTTSPVSAVSDTSGPVTLVTHSTATSVGFHPGGEMVVFLNYPYMEGQATT